MALRKGAGMHSQASGLQVVSMPKVWSLLLDERSIDLSGGQEKEGHLTVHPQ